MERDEKQADRGLSFAAKRMNTVGGDLNNNNKKNRSRNGSGEFRVV
jgi:hypothetical protein